jgi:hypothetical protein
MVSYKINPFSVHRLGVTKTIFINNDTLNTDSISRPNDSIAVITAKNNLKISFLNKLDSDTSVTSNIILTNTGTSNVNIKWSTSDSLHLKANGIIFPPDSGEVQVTLTATISRGQFFDTKIFQLSIQGKNYLGESVLKINFSRYDSLQSVKMDIGLPIQTAYGDPVIWHSSDTNIISLSGIVKRPNNGDGDSPVTLTAMVSTAAGAVQKTFKLTVKENPISSGLLQDIEGNSYKTLRIGNQEWLAENFRSTEPLYKNP